MVAKKNAQLKRIAKVHLNLETLESLRSDSLDFKEQAVWSIKAAMEAAYEAGRAAAQAEAKDASEDDDHESPGSNGSLFEAE